MGKRAHRLAGNPFLDRSPGQPGSDTDCGVGFRGVLRSRPFSSSLTSPRSRRGDLGGQGAALARASARIALEG